MNSNVQFDFVAGLVNNTTSLYQKEDTMVSILLGLLDIIIDCHSEKFTSFVITDSVDEPCGSPFISPTTTDSRKDAASTPFQTIEHMCETSNS